MIEWFKRLFSRFSSIPEASPTPASVFTYVPMTETSSVIDPTPNFIRPPSNRLIKYVIVHATAGSKESSIAWMKAPISQVSAHYVLDKEGGLTHMVQDSDVAWHAGVSSWGNDTAMNSLSIGIELVNMNDGVDPYPKIQICVLLGLCQRLCHQYGIPAERVLRHLDIAPTRKNDPRNFPWETFRKDLQMLLSSNPSKPSLNA